MINQEAPLDRLFALTQVEEDLFRTPVTGGPLARLYGGQVFAQALAALQATVGADRLVHSAHAYFVTPGDPHLPVDLRVTRDSDGRSFSARRVEARQGARLILNLSASLHIAEDGPTQQSAMPDVPPPEALAPQETLIRAAGDRLPERQHAFWLSRFAFDYRAAEPFRTFDPGISPARKHFWMRYRDPVGDDPAVHQRLLAYASDLYILHTGLGPLGISWAEPDMQDASLDHAIWFHDDRFRVDEWLLYALDSPYAGHARTLGRGTVFTRDGRVVASVAQEGLIRLRPAAQPS